MAPARWRRKNNNGARTPKDVKQETDEGEDVPALQEDSPELPENGSELPTNDSETPENGSELLTVNAESPTNDSANPKNDPDASNGDSDPDDSKTLSWPEWSVPANDPDESVEPIQPTRPTHSARTGRLLKVRRVFQFRRKRYVKPQSIPMPKFIDNPSNRKLDAKNRPADRRTVYEDPSLKYEEGAPNAKTMDSTKDGIKILYKIFPKVEKRLTAVGVNTKHLRHYNKVFTRHPESGERIEHTVKRLIVCSDHIFDFVHVTEFLNGQHEDFEDIQLLIWSMLVSLNVHSKEYLSELRNLASHIEFSIHTWCTQFDSVQMTKATAEVCLESLFLCFYMANAMYENMYFNGFALVRPPGHHAQFDSPGGFCVVNNVAATAMYLLTKPNVNKILILDVDIHHGNGTQELFYDNNKVTYLSIHRYEEGKFWPYRREADYDYIGVGRGKGHNMNVTINENGGGDTDYMYIFTAVILPVAQELRPDYILISAGYDACYGDPIGVMDIEADVFSHMIYHLSSTCNGNVLCVLEGGYNHSSVAVGVDNNVRVLSGMKPHAVNFSAIPRESTVHSCNDLIAALREYWPCLWSYYKLLPDYIGKYKQRKPVFSSNQHIVTGDVNQKQLFDCYDDVEVTHAIRPEYHVFMPRVRFDSSLIPNTKYYYLFGLEDIRHAVFDGTQNYAGYIFYFKGVDLKSDTNVFFPIDEYENENFNRRKQQNHPVMEQIKGFPWYQLIYETSHLVITDSTSCRALVVTWGFHRYVKVNTSRCIQVGVGVGKGGKRTDTYHPINLVKEPTVDGLLHLITLLLRTLYITQCEYVYLCLDENVPSVFNDPEVLRTLVWTLQGIDNRRFIIYYNGVDEDGTITALTCDPYFRKKEEGVRKPRPRMVLDIDTVEAYVNSVFFPQHKSLPNFLFRTEVIIPRVPKDPSLRKPKTGLSLNSVGRRLRLQLGQTDSSECDLSLKRVVYNVDEATCRNFRPLPILYTEGSSFEEYSTDEYYSDSDDPEANDGGENGVAVNEEDNDAGLNDEDDDAGLNDEDDESLSSLDSSSDNECNILRPDVGGTASSNPPTDDEADETERALEKPVVTLEGLQQQLDHHEDIANNLNAVEDQEELSSSDSDSDSSSDSDSDSDSESDSSECTSDDEQETVQETVQSASQINPSQLTSESKSDSDDEVSDN